MESINSFVTLAEKITNLNKNCVEILTKINDVVSSENDSVNIVYNNNGAISSYSQPTVGYLKTQIDVLNQNMKRLASIDGYTYMRDGKSFKRIMTSDLNREPASVNNIDQVEEFSPTNNHFFESLMNPLLSINVDLTDKVENVVNKIISRRYIIKFKKNSDGTLTEDGLRSFNSFSQNFLNKTSIDISSFIEWYNNTSNNGIVLDSVKPYDEQIYELNLKTLNYFGLFSVIKVEIDEINNKMWYHLNTIKYYGNDGSIRSLSIGDELIINKRNSSSRYRIKEVNVDSSNTKVTLDLVEGYDPVIVGVDVLKYYSDISNQKSVKINVGFDEHIVLFIKPINTEDNIMGAMWSRGISFYTNDLVLDINNNINLAQFYINSVYDYGVLLKDLINRNIPTFYGEKPNSVELNPDNFKVVQINKHLTDDKDQIALLKAHSSKTSTKTKINQINSAISSKTSQLNDGGSTTQQKQNLLKEINDLKSLLAIQTENLSSLISEITELNIGKNSKVSPKFRVRGYWIMPEPILSDKTRPQHVSQFRIQYRYKSKNGGSNNIETFNYNRPILPTNTPSATLEGGGTFLAPVINVPNPSINSNTTSSSTTNNITSNSIPYRINVGKNVSVKADYVSDTTERPPDEPQVANFSNWVEYTSKVRKRHWDENTDQWYWKYEEVTDPEIPNINELDVPINQNELIEVRVKSISEVGWPDTLIESDWSNILTVQFPDDLNDISSDNNVIISEALRDNTSVVLENILSSKGVNEHLNDSFVINENYMAHKDTSIRVSLNPEQNMNLFEYLTYLTNKINKLEQEISSSKGNLEIILYKNNNLIRNIKNNTTTNINIECEDYGIKDPNQEGRIYYNSTYVVDEYVVSFQNTNQSGNLGFISSRSYVSGGTNSFYSENGDANKVLLMDYNGDLYTQNDNQFIWFADKEKNDWISSGCTSPNQIPYYLSSPTYNFGATGSSTLNSPIFNVNDIFNIEGPDSLICAAFPYLSDLNDLIETGQDKIKNLTPQSRLIIGIRIFFKFSSASNQIYTAGSDNQSKNRKIKFWFNTADNTNYQFVINFKLNRYRNYLKPSTIINTPAYD